MPHRLKIMIMAIFGHIMYPYVYVYAAARLEE